MERVKWKQSIRVDRNATALMKLPCVRSCEKRKNGEYGYRMVDGSYVFEGMWLCEAPGGKWHGLTDWEMKNGV